MPLGLDASGVELGTGLKAVPLWPERERGALRLCVVVRLAPAPPAPWS